MGLAALSPDLRRLLRAVRIVSTSEYFVDGVRYEVEASGSPESGAGDPEDCGSPDDGSPDGGSPRRRLSEALAKELYRLYTRGRIPSTRPADYFLRRRHLARLSEANGGQGTWESGWRVCGEVDDGRIEVRKSGVVYRVAESRLRSDVGAGAVGASCRVRVPKELQQLVPGFYVALGNAEETAAAPAYGVRLYWHLRSAAAADWVRAVTGRLNRREIPFRLKVPSSPRDYHRADAGVLYLAPPSYAPARSELVAVYRELRSGLRREVPLLTLRLAPGLGLAEGPAGGDSFGERRCRLTAGALVGAFEAGCESEEEKGERLAAAFRGLGLDPLRPYLAAGSPEGYRPFPPIPSAGAAAVRGSRPSESFPDAAVRLGDDLCRRAFWHRGRCNWVGRPDGERDPRSGILTPTVAALAGDLYGGSAGVGLFLARLFEFSGETTHRRTAVAALRQAMAAPVREPESDSPLGLYTGSLGVAWAAAKVAGSTGDGELAERSACRLEGLLADLGGKHLLDLISGNAGSILALLDLHRELGEGRYLEAAGVLGEEICAAAVRRRSHWSWASDRAVGLEGIPPLAGISHGAAGIGLALYELAAAGGERSFLTAARNAFAYEDSLFDREHANWPDLRRPSSDEPPELLTVWCHGAPGIVLARLRAMVLDPTRAGDHRDAARAGLGTTLEALRQRLEQPDADATLCHGLAGLVEVALVAGRALGDEGCRTVAEESIRRLVARHGKDGRWPSGVASRGPNPSLMFGEAGVGYTLLRLHAPDRVPSVLPPGV